MRAVSIIALWHTWTQTEYAILCWIPAKSAAVQRRNAQGIERKKKMDLEQKAVLRLREGVTMSCQLYDGIDVMEDDEV